MLISNHVAILKTSIIILHLTQRDLKKDLENDI